MGIIVLELASIFGGISTSILDKQRSEVANLAKYVHLEELCALAPRNSQSFCGSADSTMAKTSFLGVVIFERFFSDLDSVIRLSCVNFKMC